MPCIIITFLIIIRREFRFQLPPSLSLEDVVSEIRKHTEMNHDTPFNLKWLDVEGKIRGREGRE